MDDSLFVLDIGGEGRHEDAWNLNPRTHRTVGSQRGQPIPRLIRARSEALPLAAQSVDVVIVERTPLWPATLAEILRVARPTATIILRHARAHGRDPHCVALKHLCGNVEQRTVCIGPQDVQETVIRRSGCVGAVPLP